MVMRRCVCCSVHHGAILAGNYAVIAYGTALGVTVWWIIDSHGAVPIPAYVLVSIYFISFVMSIILVLSLSIHKRSSILFAWILIMCIFLVPECGLNIYVCVWGLGLDTSKGLGFFIFYIARAIINIICIISVNSAYSLWKIEEQASKQRIADAYAATTYGLSTSPAAFYYWNYNPHFPMVTAYRSGPDRRREHSDGATVEYGVIPYATASQFPGKPKIYNGHPAYPSSPKHTDRRQRPLSAGVLVRHRIGDITVSSARKAAPPIDSTPNVPGTAVSLGQKLDKKVQHKDKAQTTGIDRRDQEDDTEDYGEQYKLPLQAVYIVEPWRLTYPPPPPTYWTGVPPPAPVPFDSYTPAPLSASALAFSAPQYTPLYNYMDATHFPVGSKGYQLKRAGEKLNSPNSQANIPDCYWTAFPGKGPAVPPAPLAVHVKNPIRPGTVFDAKGPDVEPSFSNFIMRQRVGDLGTFRPKSLRGYDEDRNHHKSIVDDYNVFDHIYRPDRQTHKRPIVPTGHLDSSRRKSDHYFRGARAYTAKQPWRSDTSGELVGVTTRRRSRPGDGPRRAEDSSRRDRRKSSRTAEGQEHRSRGSPHRSFFGHEKVNKRRASPKYKSHRRNGSGRKATFTTLLSSSYYQYRTYDANDGRKTADSTGKGSTIYGHTPVKLDDTTWTLM